MIVLLSPAKTLDFESPLRNFKTSEPALLDDAEKLVAKARRLSKPALQELMKISAPLAEENAARFKEWSRPFTNKNARPAMFAFTGDVYLGLDAPSMSDEDVAWAQKHVRILPGLYGILRPLDLMQPYRLEMGLPFGAGRAKNLYEFWGSRITEQLREALDESGSNTVVNLASNEYFKAVRHKELDAEVVTPKFREVKDGDLKMISFSAKRARGTLTRDIIDRRLNEAAEIATFSRDRYKLRKKESDDLQPLFARKFIPVAATR